MSRMLLVLWLFLMTGCQSLPSADKFAKYALPFNVALSWAGNVAIHEGGHALTAYGLGADSVRIDFVPGRDSNGDFHFALTEAEFSRVISDMDATLYNTMGPTSTFLSHVTFNELNRSGVVPRHLQATVAWMSIGGMASTYAHSVYGLARIKSTDLGKEGVWIAGVFTLAQLAYDLWRIGAAPGGFKKYLDVLIGDDFYGHEETQ